MIRTNILFLCFIALLQQIQYSLNYPSNDAKCDVDLNLQKTTVNELLKLTYPSYEDEAQYEELMGCVWKSKGLVTANGVLLSDNFRNVMIKELRTQFSDEIAKEKANEAVNYCGHITGRSPGETSVKMVKCLGSWKVQSFIDNEKKQMF